MRDVPRTMLLLALSMVPVLSQTALASQSPCQGIFASAKRPVRLPKGVTVPFLELNEIRSDIDAKPIHRFSAAELQSAALHVSNGLLLDAQGKPKTSPSIDNVVVTEFGDVYAFPDQPIGESWRKHSSVAGRGRIVLAGIGGFAAGRMVDLSNKSGRFLPSQEDFIQGLFFLQAIGIDLSQTNVIFVGYRSLPSAKRLSAFAAMRLLVPDFRPISGPSR